ncbi:MAG: alpha/beta hydrolase [Chloroflexaceae bacterium]|nr:alpha/beta hydrolase [Chloroflexaceae bacterium]NJL34529.1 alpha/beta hydrolase [Chloroflexaceae bacterium]NJO07757.1 alpha/beta hydrolase [Chloroflexaceae bacterium]
MTPTYSLPVVPTYVTWRGHRIAHYQAGSGTPVFLLHSINAAASAFEMRAQFAALQDQYAVHAIDLLGFGSSDRPARVYRSSDYIDIVMHTLLTIGRPAHLIASSLTGAYAIAVAARLPEQVRSLVLVAPTGIAQLADQPGTVQQFSYDVLRGPVGDVVYGLLSSKPIVRYFLEQQTYADSKRVTEATLKGYHRVTQQPGAKYAPICFVTGLLNYDVRNDFARLTQPILLVWGKQLKITPVQQADAFLQCNARARLEVLDNSALSNEDSPERFNALVQTFLG